jgi:molybdenum cofactor cytidylyltransferase
VLAAGFSTRLGRSKALARIHGSTLLAKTLDVLRPFATSSRILVVIPPGAGRCRIGSRARAAEFVPNPHRAAGLSSSVRLGVTRRRYCAAVLLLPVDLAELRGRDIARLIVRWRAARRVVIARRLQEVAAAPLILPRWLFERVRTIAGDHGLRDMVRRLPADRVSLVSMPSAAFDVDTVSDLSCARRRLRPGRLKL